MHPMRNGRVIRSFHRQLNIKRLKDWSDYCVLIGIRLRIKKNKAAVQIPGGCRGQGERQQKPKKPNE
jgi:hypothetical protein